MRTRLDAWSQDVASSLHNLSNEHVTKVQESKGTSCSHLATMHDNTTHRQSRCATSTSSNTPSRPKQKPSVSDSKPRKPKLKGCSTHWARCVSRKPACPSAWTNSPACLKQKRQPSHPAKRVRHTGVAPLWSGGQFCYLDTTHRARPRRCWQQQEAAGAAASGRPLSTAPGPRLSPARRYAHVVQGTGGNTIMPSLSQMVVASCSWSFLTSVNSSQTPHAWLQCTWQTMRRTQVCVVLSKVLIKHGCHSDEVPAASGRRASTRGQTQCEQKLCRLCVQHPKVLSGHVDYVTRGLHQNV